MEPQGPSEDQRLTDGERKVLVFLIVCFAVGTLSLGVKSLWPHKVSVSGTPAQASPVSESKQESPPAIPALAEEPRSKKPSTSKTPAKASVPEIVNLNTASAAQLEALPGIGPAIALRIVEDRARRGPFHSLDELGRVKGIGLKTLERLRGRVSVIQK